MPTYYTGLINEGVGSVHVLFRDFIKAFQAADRQNGVGRSAATQTLMTAYLAYVDELQAISVEYAALAQKNARSIFSRTRQRPVNTFKGRGEGLRDNLIARPASIAGVPTGSVGIGDIDRLNSVTNPFDPRGTPYWAAQEKGYAGNVGKVIRGYFFDAGLVNPTRPAPGYTGNKRSAQPVFVSAKAAASFGADIGVLTGGGSRGGSGGSGVIRNPIKPRRFLAGSVIETRGPWDEAHRAAELRAITAIRAVKGEVAAQRALASSPAKGRRR